MNEIRNSDQICRACLTTCSTDFDLLENPDVAEIYIQLSSTKLDMEGCLPTKICSDCHQRIEDIRRFQTTCIESYNSLLSKLLVNIKDEKPEILIKEEEQIEIGLSNDIEEQLMLGESAESESNGGSEYDPLEEGLSGEFKNESRSSLGDDTEKDEADSNEDEKPLTRSQIKMKRKYTKRKDSGNVDGSNKSNTEIETEPGKKGKLYYCDKCPRTFMKRWTYDGHLRVHMGLKPFACKHCPKTFTHYTRFFIHEHGHSATPPRLPCPIEGCSRDFKTRSTMSQHIQAMHTDPPISKADRPKFVCEQCGKVLSTKAILMKHALSHEKSYGCKLCTLNFPSRREVFRHMRLSHAKIRKHACTYCDQRFVRRETLRLHVMRHTGERRHECPICGKKFIQNTSFRVHCQRHNKTNDTNATGSAPHRKANATTI